MDVEGDRLELAMARLATADSSGQEHLFFRIKLVQHLYAQATDAALAPLGLNAGRWVVLVTIRDHPGASGAELAARTFQTPQALGLIAERMQEAGLIERRQGTGRTVQHHLTVEGSEMVERAADAVRELGAVALNGLDHEARRTLATSLDAVMRNLSDRAQSPH